MHTPASVTRNMWHNHKCALKLKFECCGLTYISSVGAEIGQEEPENTKKDLALLSNVLIMKAEL